VENLFKLITEWCKVLYNRSHELFPVTAHSYVQYTYASVHVTVILLKLRPSKANKTVIFTVEGLHWIDLLVICLLQS